MTTGLYNIEPAKSRFDNLNDSVILWAGEKGILDKATPFAQINKTLEEVYETKGAILAQLQGKETFVNVNLKECNTKTEIIDGFGDILVTVLIGCKMQDIDPLDALETAYNVIKGRNGKMINGTFVKKSDLVKT